jgi:hypothetical protein
VGEPVDGLEAGTTYHFAVCAEDSENPGNPFCSHDQTFTTDVDPSLNGESLFATNLDTGQPGASYVRYPSCRTEADGTVILDYTAKGFAGGPFAGTFEEDGEITVSSHEFPSDDRLLALTATFSINDGQVTGTRQLTTPTNEFQTAGCTGNERGGGPFVFITGLDDLSYTAEIHVPRGDFRDSGSATFSLVDIGTTTNIGNLSGKFTSDRASTQPVRTASKH